LLTKALAPFVIDPVRGRRFEHVDAQDVQYLACRIPPLHVGQRRIEFRFRDHVRRHPPILDAASVRFVTQDEASCGD
jgi:hypothetical protein